MKNLMTVTVYTNTGYVVLNGVTSVVKTEDGAKYRVRVLEGRETGGIDFKTHYYNVHDTEIHIG